MTSTHSGIETGVKTMVSLKGITKRYGRSVALDSVSLDIAQGEFVTLLGPSGSGKTTCLRAIAGMITPDEGVLEIAGRDVSAVPMHRRNIGMVFQNYSLFPHLTVAQNVAYPLRMRGKKGKDAQKSVEEALALVRLEAFGDRMPDQLSGGQQQRVALARALVFEPNVLLLDEPLSALDRLLREEMQLELRRIHQRTGMTMICVTHDRSEALTMSDRVVVLRDGGIVQDDDPVSIYRRSSSRFVAEFLGETNTIPMTLSADGELLDQDGRALKASAVPADIVQGPVDAVIRVESVEIVASERAGRQEPAWRGEITESVFLGDAIRYAIACGPHIITARVSASAAGTALAEGTEVGLSIPPESIMVFAR